MDTDYTLIYTVDVGHDMVWCRHVDQLLNAAPCDTNPAKDSEVPSPSQNMNMSESDDQVPDSTTPDATNSTEDIDIPETVGPRKNTVIHTAGWLSKVVAGSDVQHCPISRGAWGEEGRRGGGGTGWKRQRYRVRHQR
ncbi:hypothetical protein AAFF_G00235090 [Aldrovandia affinis]|uniref:Uncharacterized protein n=1 Tax=Aldrovandia affinis TaxID=143900 RepID=A0AAD7SWV9_9TELE|nr:hypothetical protein AAFF_G00235090 [Aldrovandia affinis]